MVKVPVINQPLQEWPGELEMYRVPGTSNRQRAALKMGEAGREAQINDGAVGQPQSDICWEASDQRKSTETPS
jgi:hypothetical protein